MVMLECCDYYNGEGVEIEWILVPPLRISFYCLVCIHNFSDEGEG